MRAAVLVCAALAACAAGRACLATEPFKPSPDFVVLTVPRNGDDLTRAERTNTGVDARAAASAARRYLQRARSERAPELVGYAEAVLRPWMQRKQVPVPLLVLQADIAQRRHDFVGAERWLDRALASDPRNPQALLMRATTRIVRGALESAAPDCRAMLASGELYAGTVCLAQVIGGSDPRRAAGVIEALLVRDQHVDVPQRAWGFAILADFSQRLGRMAAAEQHLRSAHELAPEDESYLVALADVLLETDRPAEALALLAPFPASVAVLAQRARAEQRLGDRKELARTLEALHAQFEIEERRGERVHLREQALLALHVNADPRRGLALARANFDVQRESIDVRLLARAARAAEDAAAIETITAWIAATGHSDTAVQRALRHDMP